MGSNNRHSAAKRTPEVINPSGRLEDLQVMQPGRRRRRRCIKEDEACREGRAITDRRPRPEGPASGDPGKTTRHSFMRPGELRLQHARPHHDRRKIKNILGSGQSHKGRRGGDQLQSQTGQGVGNRIALPVKWGEKRRIRGVAMSRHPTCRSRRATAQLPERSPQISVEPVGRPWAQPKGRHPARNVPRIGNNLQGTEAPGRSLHSREELAPLGGLSPRDGAGGAASKAAKVDRP